MERPRHRASRSRRSVLPLVAALAASIVVSACTPAKVPATSSSAAATGASTPTLLPSPTASATATTPGQTASASLAPSSAASQAAVYAAIETAVEQIRGLDATKQLVPTLLDEQGVRDWMTKAFQTQVDHAAMAAQSRLLEHLGLLPKGASLEQLELDLQSSQVIGFYDPETTQLYLVSQSGTVGPMQKLTFSHEFTHALQDQNFGLDKLHTDAVDQGDRDLARTALVEGDASLAMALWAQKGLSLPELLQISGDAIAGPQAAQLASAPAILRENLEFPYDAGLTFVQHLYASSGWAAVDAAYGRPPDSTSQIIHPELYDQGVRPVPVTLTAATPAGWKLALQDTFGELNLGIWLAGEGASSSASDAAKAAVTSWAGDRIGLFEGPAGAWAVVLQTEWRGEAAAGTFATAARSAIQRGGTPSQECLDGARVTLAVASDQAAILALDACGAKRG